jgi:trans-2,3-dihydro-3-hydroxyanthranilate isomerase
MNLSETVFVYPATDVGHARIRIFTPSVELPFAGHPVLGTAFVLGAPLQLPRIVLETGMGPVPITLERDGPRIVFGRMVQPIPKIEPFPSPAPLLAALGPRCRSRSTSTAPGTSASPSTIPRRWRPSSPICPPWRDSSPGAS